MVSWKTASIKDKTRLLKLLYSLLFLVNERVKNILILL